MKIVRPLALHGQEFWRSIGREGITQHLSQIYRRARERKNYQIWIKKYGVLSDIDRRKVQQKIENFKNKPLISIVMPVYDIEEKWLCLCIESVLKQIYQNWELCVADDFSTKAHIRPVLEKFAAKDGRIRVMFREANGHISAASNSALLMAKGEFTVLLDHDDEISEDALFWVANEINEFPETQMIYSDDDLIDEYGRRFGPKFKPNFSRDLFYSMNLITHLSAYRTDLLRKIGGFRVGFEGSQDYDLALRALEKIDEQQIRHIPRILHHWRAIRGSVAFSMDEKPYAHERARAAIRSHFERTKVDAVVEKAENNLHRVRYQLPELLPKVALFVHATNSAAAQSAKELFIEQTDYDNLEVIEVSEANQTNHAFNSAVSHSDSYFLCFADGRLIPQSKTWLREMAGFAFQKQIGAVGAKVLYVDDTVAGTGLVFGGDGLISIAHEGIPSEAGGNLLRNVVINNYSAISIKCMVVRRELFDLVGGFDAQSLPNCLYDGDFCLKLGTLGYRTVFTPFAELKYGSAIERSSPNNCQSPNEKKFFSEKWRNVIERDPFYNPNLSNKDGGFYIDI